MTGSPPRDGENSKPGTSMNSEQDQGRESTNSVLTKTKPRRDRSDARARPDGSGETDPSAFDSRWLSLERTDEGVVTVELDADVEFGWEFRSDLRRACRVASVDNPNAVLLTGEPGAFDMGGQSDDLESFGAREELGATLETVTTFGAPVVAATRGDVRGFGVALVLCADIRIGDSRGEYGCPGLSADHLAAVGATKRLAATVGRDRAVEFVHSGETYDAERMVDWGLLNGAADDEAAVERAMSLAEEFAGRPTVAYEHMKHAVRAATSAPGSDPDGSGRRARSSGRLTI